MPVDDNLFELSTKLPKGTQIVYVPSHIAIGAWDQEGNFLYPSGAQPGFVYSGPTKDGDYFCRYWRWDNKSLAYVPELRTKANSELTPGDRIIVTETFNQFHVVREVNQIDGKR